MGGDSKAELFIENISNPSVKALLIAACFEQLKQPVIVICPDAQTAVKYQFELETLLGKLSPEKSGAEEVDREYVERYPAEDFSPYDLSVFPVPAPAITSSGPSPCVIARLWASFRCSPLSLSGSMSNKGAMTQAG